MMAGTLSAPQERLTLSLRELYNLEREPFFLTSKEATRLLIEFTGHDPSAWFEDFWTEHEENESRLAVTVTRGDAITRYIRTAAARIARQKRYRGSVDQARALKQTVEILIEFVIEPDGAISLRKFFQNSLSGKLRWDERRPEKALWREIREELDISISLRMLRKTLRIIPMQVTYWKDLRTGLASEIDEHPSDKFPAVRTHNQIFHFIWNMPERYWRDVYSERLKNGRVLFHIWAPAEDSRSDRETMLEYICGYMQYQILRRL